MIHAPARIVFSRQVYKFVARIVPLIFLVDLVL